VVKFDLMNFRSIFLVIIFISIRNVNGQTKNLVYIDKQGVMRWSKDKKEAAFFGVNYTVPFAYGYRSHHLLGADIEKAINADVYHMWRLGLDAFRVHIWDAEITDSLGNLLNNEHLRLFDYLLSQLKKRKIRIMLTPIAFWGNGYPEPDEKLHGFSSVYGKGNAVILEPAIAAQENYLKQLLVHVNPYTKLSYIEDPDIIAAEINNEPHHSGPKEKTTEYINRLANAMRSTGWTKPVFYNISESPSYADAVAQSNVDGFSFQWYPTGLVAGHEQKGNFLPHVDQYYIPFADTIQSFAGRARMVYEFDAGDVLQSNMYPAMARSFRTAGFQWATQFAYDPMVTAYANTEYQTHYLNLAYTPSKAISLLIASKTFHRLPRSKHYGTFPDDTLFDVFRVSPLGMSEMNSEEEFYYSGSTETVPRNASKLKHIAGVGTSPIVRYDGYGAYFLDKTSKNTWRLEVMPDAIPLSDPFAKSSLKKMVTKIVWMAHTMNIHLPGLGSAFYIRALNEGNTYASDVTGNFSIPPGVYEIAADRKSIVINTNPEFYAPLQQVNETILIHKPFAEISAGKPFPVEAIISGIDSIDRVLVELRPASGRWNTVTMEKTNSYTYTATIPANVVNTGMISYRILVRKQNQQFIIFPGGRRDDPYAWDHLYGDSWKTFVASNITPIVLFDPLRDLGELSVYNPDWRNNSTEFITAEQPGKLVLKGNFSNSKPGQFMAWQFYLGEELKGRKEELADFNQIIIRCKSDKSTRLTVGLVMKDGQQFTADVEVDTIVREKTIPLNLFHSDSLLLLPRPYPGFQPLWFISGSKKNFDMRDAERLTLMFGKDLPVNSKGTIEIGSVWLTKK
jgi:hypothetical protein